MPTLPPRQLECLLFVAEYASRHEGRFPTHREIAAALGLRSTTAAVYLAPLRRKELLAPTARAHRGWRVTPLGRLVLAAASAPPPPPRPRKTA